MAHNCTGSAFAEAYLSKFEVIRILDTDKRKELKGECPVCMQSYNEPTVTTSTSCKCGHYPIQIVDCGHLVHAGCYMSLVFDKKYACPHCTVVPKFLSKSK